MTYTLRKYARALLPLVALALLGLVVGAYILSQQRLRFPFFEEEPFRVKIELPTGQAVTPGQGQTVRVSGVQVGVIGKVELDQGHALVTMEMEPKYERLIRRDATALLRPKTTLKDMFIELDPGTKRAALVREGGTIPIANTLPDTNPDEIYAMLDADTRAYLKLLVHGAGRGLEGRGSDLREVFRLFEPTHRDLARVTSSVATRRASLRRLINSLNRLSEELGGKEDELAELVDSAAHVFRAYASEDQNISRAVRELPRALRQTTDTLGKVERFARVLGPATEELRPAARSLGRAQVALRPLARKGTPILRDQVRPFVREARPLVRDLRPAARNLSTATPNLTRTFTVLNRLLNMVGHNPRGREGPEDPNRDEGYLFYTAWLPHTSVNAFATADAHGSFRPSLVSGSCQTLRSLADAQPELEFVLNLTPITENPTLCGTD